MATAPTSTAFWDQLAESRLLSAEQLAALRSDRIDAGVTSDADLARRLVKRGLLTDYQADRLLEGRARGFFFDQYKILDVLGVGGMGWVYQAEDTTTGQTVALKVLQDQLKHDAGMKARFLQEARVGLKLHHPNIVETYHLGSAGGLPYMVMEFVRGPSLLEVLQLTGPIKWKQACEFARQAALGLDYAHQAGVIHRDVKPQNLLVDNEGRIHLLDFGLSMVKEGEQGEEFSMAMIFGHESVGTAEFSAPEQAADSLAADARSDVYSLGGTLFTMLTAGTPFQGKTVAEMLKAHRTDPVPSVCKFVKGVPQGVADIVMKMMAKQPADRYATAAEAAAALAEFAKPGPVSVNFDIILAGRKEQAQKKIAMLSKARSTASGLRGSTARPTTISSVTGKSSTKNGEPPSEPELPQIVQPTSPAPVQAQRRAGQPIESPAVLTALETDVRTPLKLDQLLLGRKEDCDVPVHDNAVSGRHCELRFDGFHWWVTDLNSRNGTFVNNIPVQQQMLKDGDILQLGTNRRFRFDATGVARTDETPKRKSHSTIIAAVVLILLLIAAGVTWWMLAGNS